MRLSSLLFVGLATGTLAALYAQQNPSPNPPAPRSSTHDARAAEVDDGILATWLLVANDVEIALSQLAVERAQSPDVKQFAQKMVDDHRHLGLALEPFAKSAGYHRTTAISPPDARPTGPATPDGQPEDRPQDTTSNAGGHKEIATPIDHAALLQELGQQCLSSARKELESKQGVDFDRCYLHMAVGAHMQVNDEMTVFQWHASSDLEKKIAEGQGVVRTHLEHAKQLCMKFDEEGGKRGK